MQIAARNLLPDIRDMLWLSLGSEQASAWLTREQDSLGGASPMRCLAEGRFDEVYRAVLALDPQR